MAIVKFTAKPKDMAKRLKQFEKLTLDDMDEIVNASALIVQSRAKKEISRGSRSGRVYRRKPKTSRGRQIVHQASRGQPNSSQSEYPKSDSGRLVISIRSSVTKRFESNVGSNLPYAEYLEEGTRNMDARPWLSRAGRESEPDIKKKLRSVLSKRGIN